MRFEIFLLSIIIILLILTENSTGRIISKRDVSENLGSQHGRCNHKKSHPKVMDFAAKAAANAHTASESQDSVAKNFATLAGEMVKNDMAEKAAMEAKMAQLAYAAKEELVELSTNELKVEESIMKQQATLKDEIDQQVQISQQGAQESINLLKAVKAVERLAEKHTSTSQEELQELMKAQGTINDLEQETMRREQELASELSRERCDLDKTKKAAVAATAAAQRAKQNTSNGGGAGIEMMNASGNMGLESTSNDMFDSKMRRIKRRTRKRDGTNC